MTLEEKTEAYKEILDEVGLELKGKNNLYTSMNGHMFSFVGKPDVVAIRISKEDQETFLKKFDTPFPVKQYGSNMRDYVELPDELLTSPKKAATWFKKKCCVYKNTQAQIDIS